MSNSIVIREGQTAEPGPLNVFGDMMYIKLAGKDTNGTMAVMECVTQPNEGPPLHMHHREDEGFYILEGDFLFEIDGQRVEAHTGDFLWAKRGTRHCFQNVGTKPARLLLTLEPAGLELFFAELAALEGPPEPAKVLPIFDKYELELLGPPLAAR